MPAMSSRPCVFMGISGGDRLSEGVRVAAIIFGERPGHNHVHGDVLRSKLFPGPGQLMETTALLLEYGTCASG